MPIDRTAALLEGHDLEHVDAEISNTKDLVITRTQAAGTRIWRDVWLFPLIALLLDVSLTSFFASEVTWDSLILGPVGVSLFGIVMAVLALIDWRQAASLQLSVKHDLFTYRSQSYPISQLSLPRVVEGRIVVVSTGAGEDVQIFGRGSAVSRRTATRRNEIAERLNTAIQLHERRAAFLRITPRGQDPFRDATARPKAATAH